MSKLSNLYFAVMKDIITEEVDMLRKFSSLTIKDYNDMDKHIAELPGETVQGLLALSTNYVPTEAVINNDSRAFGEFFKKCEHRIPESLGSEILDKFRIYFFLGLFQVKKPGTKNVRRDIDDILLKEYDKNIDNFIMYQRAVRKGIATHLKANYTKPVGEDRDVDTYQNVHDSFVRMMTNKFFNTDPSKNLLGFLQEYWNGKVIFKTVQYDSEIVDETINGKVEEAGAVMSNKMTAKAMIAELTTKIHPTVTSLLPFLTMLDEKITADDISLPDMISRLDSMPDDIASMITTILRDKELIKIVRAISVEPDVVEFKKLAIAGLDYVSALTYFAVDKAKIDLAKKEIATDSEEVMGVHMLLHYPMAKQAIATILDSISSYENVEIEVVAADKAIADKLAADKAIADKLAADKAIADKAIADKLAADKAIADKAIADKLAADKAIADKLAADKAIADKLAADKADEVAKREKEVVDATAKLEKAKKEVADAEDAAKKATEQMLGIKDKSEPALRVYLTDLLKNDLISKQIFNLRIFNDPGVTFAELKAKVDKDSTDPDNTTQKGLKLVMEIAKEYGTDELRIITLMDWIKDPGNEQYAKGRVA